MLHDLADQLGIIIVTGLAALVVAGVVLLFTESGRSRESAAGEREFLTPVDADAEHDLVDRRGPRYLEIYHALAVSPRDELDPVAEQPAAPEPAALPWPQSARAAAKATKLPT